MKLSGSLSRKSSKAKGFSIKVDKRLITASEKDQNSTEMSAASVEVSESVKFDTMPVIYENGKEGNHEKEENESPSMSNGSEAEVNEEAKSEENEKGNEQPSDEKSVKEIEPSVENASSNSPKDEEIEMKKQRSGTPQRRSSTPQRKSGRIRTKQLSPSKSSTATNSVPPMKILKINLTPCKASTNGTVSNEKSPKVSSGDSAKPKKKDVEDKEKVEPTVIEEKEVVEIEASDNKEVENQKKEEEEKPDIDADLPYLRSLRLISGRRSLSRSPYSPSESNVSFSQSKKKLSRRKDTYLKDDSEADLQVTEYEFHTSTISGKRKADRIDDQASSVAESSLKKPKNEEDEIHLYLMDDGEDKHSSEMDLNVSGLVDDSQKSSSSKQYSSADEEVEESNLLDKDYIIVDESMEVGREAKEGYFNSPDSPTPSNRSGKRKWCVLM
ncbi:hypothetical protein J437_LFUL010830 [Ladona fulva]|uniref:Uncharacterized protein n=1 Tax=Ladona fulva TaxID=123851 RepID=A0A8K0KE67_LADFU|nr:hypothetical protein J437_LFUL010830 [Ladona fulva]